MHEMTKWEKREYARLLATETPEWREKRRVAEDPNTTSEMLAQLAGEAANERQSHEASYQAGTPSSLLACALAAHPNTPPFVFAGMLTYSPLVVRALCGNPVVPLLFLETPDFAKHLRSPGRRYCLLQSENAPPVLARAIANLPYPSPETNSGIAEELWEANLHIAVAGKVQSHREWEMQFKEYWRVLFSRCISVEKSAEETKHDYEYWSRRSDAHLYSDLYETGLIPAWVGNEPLGVTFSKQEELLIPEAQQWLRFEAAPNSTEERTLWAKIAPDFTDDFNLAAFLRADATEKQLTTLADKEPLEKGGNLRGIIASHPNTTPRVMARLLQTKSWGFDLRLLVQRPDVTFEIIAELTQCSDAEARRLARRHPDAPKDACSRSRIAALTPLDTQIYGPVFRGFLVILYGGLDLKTLEDYATGFISFMRLSAALALPARPVPLPGNDAADLTTRDLLDHLAHDGNRLVRYAAQTRLADPDFVFTGIYSGAE